ncbi:hypothetical protein A9R01_01590 ['Osedax' symbiont bacterium Rs2_46_30_T18]|nr:hypothetical protein A9R01_01590 ['Osedax' symbiont bacterium Rs2_46_30_T18]
MLQLGIFSAFVIYLGTSTNDWTGLIFFAVAAAATLLVGFLSKLFNLTQEKQKVLANIAIPAAFFLSLYSHYH